MIRWTVPLAVAFACAPLAAQEPAQDSIYPVAQVEVRPEALNGEELGAALYARYPAPLKAAGVSGQVTVSMVVGPDGVPRNLELVSSTDTLFNAPTLEVASLLRFLPAQVGGRPVPVRVILPVPWHPGPPEDTPGPDALGGYGLNEVNVPPRPTKATFLRQSLERYDPSLPRIDSGWVSVDVRLLVNPDGTSSHARVTRSVSEASDTLNLIGGRDPANEAFDALSLAAVQALRFTPGRLSNRPVPVWVKVPVSWSADAPGPDLRNAYTLRGIERQPQPTNVQALQRALERAYPPELRDAGVTATVKLRFRVDREGIVRNPVVSSSTDERFNEATLTAIQVLRFRPAQIGRKRVVVWVELPIEWTMHRGTGPEIRGSGLETGEGREHPRPGQRPIGCTINTPLGCG